MCESLNDVRVLSLKTERKRPTRPPGPPRQPRNSTGPKVGPWGENKLVLQQYYQQWQVVVVCLDSNGPKLVPWEDFFSFFHPVFSVINNCDSTCILHMSTCRLCAETGQNGPRVRALRNATFRFFLDGSW
jgi:hypothetical protein